nr:uncharacterized protein CTRU02_11429 [Colletotrichum truncatum]KAF6785804.1 hypothetical protein CTRU02_11429 [Colletotrichum truncatum]
MRRLTTGSSSHNDVLNVPGNPFAELNEARLGTLYASVLKPCAHNYLLSIVCFVKGTYFDLFGVLAEGQDRSLSVAIVVFEGVVFEVHAGGGGAEFCASAGLSRASF